MNNQKLEFKEINNFIFYKPKYGKDWVISGIDICRYLGYKNPQKQAEKIYSKYKDNFTKSSYVLDMDRKVATPPSLGGAASYERSITIRCYTRPGCWFFVSKCNIDKANHIIENLFSSFDDLLKVLESKNTLEWKEAREQGKAGRRQMTDAVKLFIEYCKDNGSENADKYYIHFTKVMYEALGYKGKVPKNFRNNLSAYELAVLNLLEMSTDKELYDLMSQGMDRKEIFKEFKKIALAKSMAIINRNNVKPIPLQAEPLEIQQP